MDVERLLSRAAEDLSVRRAFGPAIERDGALIIPVAWVAGGGGGGAQGPQAQVPQAEGLKAEEGNGSGAGGGFGGVTWPLGVYVIKEGRVRWVPVVDATRIALAGLGIFRAVVKLRALRHMGRHMGSKR